jgi:lipopolysaccharide transport system ATP-binding protein
MMSDDIRSATLEYLLGTEGKVDGAEWVNDGGELANPWFRPLRFRITDGRGRTLAMPASNDEEMWICIEGEIRELDPALTVGYAIYSQDGTLLYWSYQTDCPEKEWPRVERGTCSLRSRLPARLLNEGKYRMDLIGSLHYREWLFEPGVNSPSIVLTIKGGLSDSPYWMSRRPGLLAPLMKWEVLRGGERTGE